MPMKTESIDCQIYNLCGALEVLLHLFGIGSLQWYDFAVELSKEQCMNNFFIKRLDLFVMSITTWI